MEHEELELLKELELLTREHRELDQAINIFEQNNSTDRLSIQRMKKRKLVIKDRISAIKSILYPDIIA